MTPRRGIAVEVRGVHQSFGARRVLRGIDLALAPGELVAILGRSGCGKSTLLRAVAGLDPIVRGAIVLGDDEVAGLDPRARVVFQEPRLLPWRRVLTNVGVGCALEGDWRRRAQHALARVGLGDRGDDWPAQLSGGQRQRVALARALVAEPPLVLFDEPFGALDALTRLEMHGLVERLWLEQGFTALLVTHDVEEAVALGDRVVLLDAGAVAVDREIELPRPRRREHPDFVEHVRALRDAVMSDGARPERLLRS